MGLESYEEYRPGSGDILEEAGDFISKVQG